MTREQLIELRWLLNKWAEEQLDQFKNVDEAIWAEEIADIIDEQIKEREEN